MNSASETFVPSTLRASPLAGQLPPRLLRAKAVPAPASTATRATAISASFDGPFSAAGGGPDPSSKSASSASMSGSSPDSGGGFGSSVMTADDDTVERVPLQRHPREDGADFG